MIRKHITIIIYVLTVSCSIKICAQNTIKNFIKEKCNNTSLSNIERIEHAENEYKEGTIELSEAYHELALCFYRKRELPAAIEVIKKAIAIKNKFRESHTKLYRKSVFSLGTYYSLNKDYQNSIITYKSLLSDLISDQYTGKANRALGNIYKDIGDFEKALMYYQQALHVFNSLKDAKNVFKTHLYLSELYNDRDRKAYALEIFKHIKVCDSLSSDDKSLMSDKRSIILNLRKANTFFDLGQYDQVEYILNNIKSLAKKTKNRAGVFSIEVTLGNTALAKQDYKRAYKHLGIANDNAKFKDEKALIANNFGDYYEHIGDLDNAEEWYLKSLTLLTESRENKLPALDQLAILPYKIEVLDYLGYLGRFYYRTGITNNDQIALSLALNTYKLADKLIDIIRDESTEYVSKLFWRTKSSEIYDNGIATAYALEQWEDAFYFMEKNKALLLLESLTDQKAKDIAQIPDSLKIKATLYKKRIEGIRLDLLDTPNKDKGEIQAKLLASKRDYEVFSKQLETDFPNYRLLKKQISIVKMDDVSSNLLDENTASLSFTLSDSIAYVHLQTKQSQQFFKIKNIEDLQKDIQQLSKSLEQPFFKPEAQEAFNRLAHRVYQHLFVDVAAYLEDIDHLIIIPDGVLNQLPFEVLQPTYSNNHGSPDYLLHHKTISYGMSLSHLIQNRTLKRTPKQSFLGVAPIEFASDSLVSLLRTEQEVNEAAQLLGGDFLMHSEANKTSMLQKLKDYNIIHLATHADIDEEDNTWLWLHDKKLYSDELYATNNNADLVVLSACKTLQGKLVRGEGQLNLTRGFLNSGANSVVASLWNANDKSHQEITLAFYQNLKDGQTKSQALSNAKKHYLRTHHGSDVSPYYWASSILIGDGTSLNMINTIPLWYWVVGIGLLMLLFFLFRRIRKNN